MLKSLLSLFILFIFLGGSAMALELKSPAFKPHDKIPSLYSCQGKDISPSLTWEGSPAGTKSFALICDDPDAPGGDWVHWVVYNIPAHVNALPEGIPGGHAAHKDGLLSQGLNDFGNIGYGGPCPPQGKPHRYFFKFYALDTVLILTGRVDKVMLLEKMEGHVLAQTELVGIYQR